MTSSTQVASLYRRFLRLAASWPIDPLRPHLSFGSAIQTNVGRGLLASPPPPPPPSSPQASGAVTGARDEVHDSSKSGLEERDLEKLQYKQFQERDLQYAERALEALESLKEGKETNEHPIAESILRPKSEPEYYSKIRSAIEKAASGEPMSLTFAQRVRVFFGRRP